MLTTKRYLLSTFCILLTRSLINLLLVQSIDTFRNPLKFNCRFTSHALNAGEADDPVMVLFKDDYYLFALPSGG